MGRHVLSDSDHTLCAQCVIGMRWYEEPTKTPKENQATHGKQFSRIVYQLKAEMVEMRAGNAVFIIRSHTSCFAVRKMPVVRLAVKMS